MCKQRDISRSASSSDGAEQERELVRWRGASRARRTGMRDPASVIRPEKSNGGGRASRIPHLESRIPAANVSQYVARPPLMSNTAPVENEQSSEASQQMSAAISVTSTKRPIGMRESM